MSDWVWKALLIVVVWVGLAVVYGAVTWVGGGEPKPPEGTRDE